MRGYELVNDAGDTEYDVLRTDIDMYALVESIEIPDSNADMTKGRVWS
ncbi:hypothetical protein CIPOMM044M_02960 [Citrobacter portucalensis]